MRAGRGITQIVIEDEEVLMRTVGRVSDLAAGVPQGTAGPSPPVGEPGGHLRVLPAVVGVTIGEDAAMDLPRSCSARP